jgi:putative lipoic acid-binding regulatory protein
MNKDYSKLKELLEAQETFPSRFTYKFVGRNSDKFARSVERLEQAYPALRHETTRKSANDQHMSKTYLFEAPSADAIIDVFRAIEQIEDLLVIL